MREMTIAELANSLRGIPREAFVLIQTNEGPRGIAKIVPLRVARTEDGELKAHSSYDGYAIVLHPERHPKNS